MHPSVLLCEQLQQIVERCVVWSSRPVRSAGNADNESERHGYGGHRESIVLGVLCSCHREVVIEFEYARWNWY